MGVIDLNADLGEGADDEALYRFVSSANIACGGHAGDAASMELALERARAFGVAIGAHPSYPDRERFGRISMRLDRSMLADSIERQIRALLEQAVSRGLALAHVKPHGALYNDAARDPLVAETIAEAALRVSPSLVLLGLAGSAALATWRARGLPVAAEGFCDRGYEPGGTLIPRDRAGAVIHDPDAMAAQALRLARAGDCRTLCVHSDTPGAAAGLAAVRERLEDAGFTISASALR